MGPMPFVFLACQEAATASEVQARHRSGERRGNGEGCHPSQDSQGMLGEGMSREGSRLVGEWVSAQGDNHFPLPVVSSAQDMGELAMKSSQGFRVV